MLTSTRNSIYTLQDFWSERPTLLLMPWVSGRAWASISPEQQFTTLPSVSSYAATLPLLSINGVLTTSITTRHWKYHGEQENHLVSLEGQRLGQRWHTNMPLQSHVVNAAVIIQCFGGPAGKKSGRKRVMGNQTVLKHLMWMGVALPHTMNCGSRWMSEVCVFHILSFSSLQLGAVFWVHLVFLMDNIGHKQMQNSCDPQIVP